MNRVIVLLGFCTAGKSTILRYFRNKYSKNTLCTIDTDEEVAKEYDNHIYNVYTVFYKEISKEDGKKNIQDALDYIEKKEKEILVKLANECYESKIPYLIALGPNTVEREPQWGYFKEVIDPICYHLELDKKEVYEGLISRIKKLKSDKNKITKSKSFGCWDNGSTMKYENGKYEPLSEEDALQNIKDIMCKPCEKYRELSKRTFSATEIKENSDYKRQLYNSIEEDLFF